MYVTQSLINAFTDFINTAFIERVSSSAGDVTPSPCTSHTSHSIPQRASGARESQVTRVQQTLRVIWVLTVKGGEVTITLSTRLPHKELKHRTLPSESAKLPSSNYTHLYGQ